MLYMASEVLQLPRVARNFEGSAFWQFVGKHWSHVEWVGWSFWDLIQPSFMFMVGVALPFSVASRRSKGQSFAGMLLHALYRSAALILLGVFLRSDSRQQTYFTFEDVLTQIGLGYSVLFWLALARPKVQWLAAFALLVGYWGLFAAYPTAASSLNTEELGVPQDWPHRLSGFAAHWNKNTNPAADFDQWFLNLFPRQAPFRFNAGGYQTLNFIPSLATMIFGLLAGSLLQTKLPGFDKIRILACCGVAGLAAGVALNWLGVCPLVKRIWTPTWTIFSTGWACLFLAAFYWVIDLRGYRKWAFPLLVVGMNSIAMYCLEHLSVGFVSRTLKIHFGQPVFNVFGPAFAPLTEGIAVLLVLWLTLLWMHRRKIFLRI